MIRNNNKENKMTFKIHDNDKTTVSNLMSKLHDNGIDIWIQMNMNDMSACKWRFLDSPSPNIFGTMDQPLVHGGIGALIRDMKEACFNHGIMKRPERISNRNHVRASINGKAIWTTANGG
tara:strand:+ start:266 stop:625 length:360 start_codon:yes stop_codon:yes gene_type:complete